MLSCRSCGDQAADPFQSACFPVTPDISVKVDKQTADCPVWMCIHLLRLLEVQQYHTKAAASDYAMSEALLRAQRSATPRPGPRGDIQVIHLTQSMMRKYVSTGLREFRYLNALVHKQLEDAAYPEDVPGHELRQCRICSEGVDRERPLTIPPQTAGSTARVVEFSEEMPRRPCKVCTHMRTTL